MNATRRLFLRHAGALSSIGAASAPLALNLAAIGSAAATAASDYKAIVCIFLYGGNDSINMVLPTDTSSFANYTTVRNQAPESIALLAPGTVKTGNGTSPAQLGGVLPIAPSNPQAGRTYALHPAMAALQAMFNTDKTLAILPNVGPLILPTTKAQYLTMAHPRPASLFSHNDQQNTWQSFQPEGATLGWGGRMADMLAAYNAQPVFSAVSAAGNAVWLAGQNVRQYQVSTGGAIRLGGNAVYGSVDVAAAMQRIVTSSRGGHVLERDLAAVSKRSVDAEATLGAALLPAGDARFGTPSATYSAAADPKLQYPNPNGGSTFNSLAQQLQVVARMIDASSAAGVGAKRQVFFVSLGGFDTHDAENANHAQLMARLAHAMRYFSDTLAGMGASNQVTTFTASDFGRTFTSNGDGTDHGWGAHHFVMGGAVKGGALYGTFPTYGTKNPNDNQFDSSPDQLGNGVLLPTTSVDQLGATLGKWFGLSDTQLLDVFPNLRNFSVRNLGFMA
jgi:uncharacterized protein (DUF1501 family)